jgi:undecaprenyl-diphosphatase
MIQITALGSGVILTLVTAMVAAYLFSIKKPATALFVIGAVAGGAILSALLKAVFERPRPELVAHLVSVSSASFPSGHAMNSAVTYLTLGSLLAKSEKSRPVRIYLVSVAVFLTLLVGFSRIYLGVHWPTDVLAGWCVGSTWAIGCSLLAQFFQERRALEQAGHNQDS